MAEPVSFERSFCHLLTAAESGYTFEIHVQVPFGYDRPAKRYPVVYVLDGDVAFPMASGVLDMLTKLPNIEEIQYAILVGITYTNKTRAGVYGLRSRDYTPTPNEAFNATGGEQFGFNELVVRSGEAAQFLSFLRDDLVPFIDKTYRTNSAIRVIHGHSFGGLFLLYTLFNQPDLFHKWLISSPSIWWDDMAILAIEQTYAENHNDLEASIYMSAGRLEEVIVEGVEEIVPRLQARAYPGLKFDHEIINGETHLSVWAGAFTRGIVKMLGVAED